MWGLCQPVFLMRQVIAFYSLFSGDCDSMLRSLNMSNFTLKTEGTVLCFSIITWNHLESPMNSPVYFLIFKIKISQQRFCHIFTFLLKYFIISNHNAFWRTMSYGSTSSPALVIPPVHQVSTNLGFIHCIIFQDIFFPELHSIPCRSCKELTSIVSFWFSMLQM